MGSRAEVISDTAETERPGRGCRILIGEDRGRQQGVLIPESNVQNLMLRKDVVEAIAENQFHVFPVQTIDQGIELLTGVPAGERDADGVYPEGSINRLVEERLRAMAEKAREMRGPREEDKA